MTASATPEVNVAAGSDDVDADAGQKLYWDLARILG